MFVEIVFLAVLIWFIFKLNEKPQGLPPGSWGLPLLGNIFNAGFMSSKRLKENIAKHGDIFCEKVGSLLFVYIADFSKIKVAFSKPEFQGRPKFFTFQYFMDFKNLGIAASEGETWSTERRFALRHLRDLGLGKTRIQTSIQKEASELVAVFEKTAGQPTELGFELNVAVLNVIWQLVTSTRYAVDDPQMKKFTALTNESLEFMQGPIALYDALPWLYTVLPRFIQNKVFKLDKMDNIIQMFDDFQNEVIQEHITKLDPENPKDYMDFYLLEMKKDQDLKTADFKDLIQSVSDLFDAGSETTSTTTRWMVLLFAKYPEIQKKLHILIDEVIPRDREPALEDRENLVYVDAAILDALRFSSLTAYGVAHATTSDTMFEGYKIPKNAVIMPCHEYCHRNSKYFERPDDFYPEHFIGENGELITKREGFAPFSIGRRQCLGESLAKAELFLFITALLQNFVISPAPGEPLDTSYDESKNLFNFPKPYKVIFTKR